MILASFSTMAVLNAYSTDIGTKTDISITVGLQRSVLFYTTLRSAILPLALFPLIHHPDHTLRL
jgi:hypothetical protein